MPARITLYAATSNPGKLAEFTSAALSSRPDNDDVRVIALPGLAHMPEPVEDASTFMGNAELKAMAYSCRAPGHLVFADDSGLEANALHGAPGVRSARFAEDLDLQPTLASGTALHGDSKDQRNNLALLSQMEFHTDRSARFVCAIALARDGQVVLRSTGSVEGQLLTEPRGADGFGYDPLFLIPTLGLTLAEIPKQQKWELSHRGRAFRSLLAQIRTASL